MMMVWQKNPLKLEPRYCGPFEIVGYSSEREISYQIRYIEGPLFPRRIHDDHHTLELSVACIILNKMYI